MLIGILVVGAVVLTAWVISAGLRRRGVISEHLRIELERRAAERRLQRLAQTALRQMLHEAGLPSSRRGSRS